MNNLTTTYIDFCKKKAPQTIAKPSYSLTRFRPLPPLFHALTSVAMRPGRLEDARNRDVEFPVSRQRRIAQLLVEVFGNADRVEEAKAVEGAAELFLGSGVDELLALLLRQNKFLDLERRRMGGIATEVVPPPVDALALFAKLERRGKDGRYGGGAKEEKRSSDQEVHCGWMVVTGNGLTK